MRMIAGGKVVDGHVRVRAIERADGDRKIVELMAEGLSRQGIEQMRAEERAAARKRERQTQKIAQFRAAALVQPKWYEVPVACAFAAIWGISDAIRAGLDALLGLPGHIGRFFRGLYRWLCGDSHMPWAGLIGLAAAYGLFGVAVCKLVMWLWQRG